MGKYKYLFIHCTATVERQIITPDDIDRMHRGARDLPNGKVKFSGKIYNSRKDLPGLSVGGVLAKDSNGRGWDRVGYSKLFTQDGKEHILTDHNEDNWIDSNEITWGASGFNSISKHFVYSGGLSNKTYTYNARERHYMRNTMTKLQEQCFIDAIQREIENHPDIKVIGHNQVEVKGCPCFDTRIWLEVHGIPLKNIDNRPMKVDTMTPFINSEQGNNFRSWVNDNKPEVAKAINLDRTGSFKNSYILRAWYLTRFDYFDHLIDIQLEKF